jgi:hypothetical protein
MLTIRPISQPDLPDLSSLWLEQTSLLSQVDSRHSPEPSTLEQWLSGMCKLLDDSQVIALMAHDEDTKPVGFLIAWEPPVGLISGTGTRVGIIGDLVIDMHRYRGGAARQLVTAVRGAFELRGVTRLAVISPSRHAVGQAFWRSMGAVEWIDIFWLR